MRNDLVMAKLDSSKSTLKLFESLGYIENPIPLPRRKLEHSYVRTSPETRKLEYIGYAGMNISMNTGRGDEGEWFRRGIL